MTERRDSTGSATAAQLVRPERDAVVLTSLHSGKGAWVGCPAALYEPEAKRYWLTYRHRRPRGEAPDRGWRCGVAQSTNGVDFEEVWAVEKAELGTSSMERFCLTRDPLGGGYLLYLSFVDPSDNRWRVDLIEAPTPGELDIRNRRPVLDAETTGTESVKDPVVLEVGQTVYLFVSFASGARLAVGDRQRAHAEADIYNAGVTTHPTAVATSSDGRAFRWQGEVLGVGETWDRYQARLSAVISCGDDVYLGLYDGSAGVDENYEERCGLAISGDLRTWRRITTDAPALASPDGTGSLRYCSAVRTGTDLCVYYECARPDDSHDIRVSRVPLSVLGTLAAEHVDPVSSHV